MLSCFKAQKGTFAKPKDSNESAVTPAVAIDNVTNSWQARVKTNWMCKKSGAQHSFFLSYRVDTEKSFSQTLAHALDAGVRSSLTIHAFLDVHCLTSGAEWIDSFIIGLWNSTVFVPVCSDAAMRKMKAAHETPDNMLLEWEIALDIRDKNLHDISIFPVLVGEYLTVAIPDPVAGTRDRRVLATFSASRDSRCLPQPSIESTYT
ncbi:hypothetical protein BC829DRAFT_82356 [Chytridium lagenaria]|nr:hypothetical protein BC829DRAFT_82356 [Chytridium lagenaria]